jgi:hypothetical protein
MTQKTVPMFFSVSNPGRGEKPDMGFVYHFNRDYNNIFILAVGLRNSKEMRESNQQHSIYYIAASRLRRREA